MRVHVIGAGPTGLSIAWELSGTHEVTVYDGKPGAGGSWWEPEVARRDLHAHRAVFNNAFINTQSLFKEMGIRWDDIFVAEKGSVYGTLLASLGPADYWALASLAVRVLADGPGYAAITLRDALGPMSATGRRLVETLAYTIDGVPWSVMSAYEFVQSFNHVGLSTPQTQRVSGKVMADAMRGALEARGVTFVFGATLDDVDYGADGFKARFADGTEVDDGLLVLCVDHNAAPRLIKDNWGPVHARLTSSAYECINVLFDFEEPVELKNALRLGMDSEWTVLPEMLEGGRTLSCVLCALDEEILTTDPETLGRRVLEQLGGAVPSPSGLRIGWGSTWDGTRWRFSQSAGVLSTQGQVPFYGRCPRVALCGMMSARHTPYASIEAATEVGRRFCHETFGTREPLRPLLITEVAMLLIVFVLLLCVPR